MRLLAAVVPPESARKELHDLVQSVSPNTPELATVPVRDMRIPVTSFGNVAQRDAEALLAVLRQAAAKWSRPELHFSGSAALEWPGDEAVWARLDGDLDALTEIGRGVPVAVQPLGFLVDRRKFRTWLPVGTITDHTTAPYLERLTAAMDAFHGHTWTLETLTVIRRVPRDHETGVDEVVLEEIPFGKTTG